MNDENSTAARKAWMSLLATASEPRLQALWQGHGAAPACAWLRRPETGSIMLRGRMGGSGAPFNAGEMTVTRCALRLEDGTAGYSYVQGRSHAKAEIAAKIDALMQTGAAPALRAAVLEPLAAEQRQARAARAAKAAATKVEFFTMARGEDA